MVTLPNCCCSQLHIRYWKNACVNASHQIIVNGTPSWAVGWRRRRRVGVAAVAILKMTSFFDALHSGKGQRLRLRISSTQANIFMVVIFNWLNTEEYLRKSQNLKYNCVLQPTYLFLKNAHVVCHEYSNSKQTFVQGACTIKHYTVAIITVS
jgi:hypothetical protein